MSFSLLQSQTRKRRSIVRRFPVLFPLVVFILLLLIYQSFDRSLETPAIGIVEVNGVIVESEPIIKKLRMLEDNSAVVGIIVRINSPGGAVSPSQEIYSEILRLKRQKPVFTSIGSTAASGGYYIAVASDKLFANPGSMIGSIGVIIQTFNIKGLLDKLGIEPQIIKAGENKDLGSVFRAMNQEEKDLLKNVVDDTHHQFIMAVAENRSMSFSEVKAIADGRIFTGNQAQQIGLIDQTASFRQTIDELRKHLNIDQKLELIYPQDREEMVEDLLNWKSLLGLEPGITHTGLFYLATPLINP